MSSMSQGLGSGLHPLNQMTWKKGQHPNGIYLKEHGMIAWIATSPKALSIWEDYGWEREEWGAYVSAAGQGGVLMLWKETETTLQLLMGNSVSRLWVRPLNAPDHGDADGPTFFKLDYEGRWLTGDVTLMFPKASAEEQLTLLRTAHPHGLDAGLVNVLKKTLAKTRIVEKNVTFDDLHIKRWECEKQDPLLALWKAWGQDDYLLMAHDMSAGTAFKSYSMMRRDEVAVFIAKTPTPFYYELIPRDTPVKCVIDVEMPWTGMPTWEERKHFKEAILRYLQEALKTTAHTLPPASATESRWTIKNNTREGKMSIHCILQNVLCSDHTFEPKVIALEAKRRILEDYHKGLCTLAYTKVDKRTQKTVVETAIDGSIYSANRVIRLLGCSKRKEEGGAHTLNLSSQARVDTQTPDEEELTKGDPRWIEAFNEMLVTHPSARKEGNVPFLTLKEPWKNLNDVIVREKDQKRPGGGARRRARGETELGNTKDNEHRPPGSDEPGLEPWEHDILNQLLNLLARTGNPDATLSKLGRNTGRFWNVSLAQAHVCRLKKATHQNNNIKVSIDLWTGKVRQFCHDQACMDYLSQPGVHPPVLGTLQIPTDEDVDDMETQEETHKSNEDVTEHLRRYVNTWPEDIRQAWERNPAYLLEQTNGAWVIRLLEGRVVLTLGARGEAHLSFPSLTVDDAKTLEEGASGKCLRELHHHLFKKQNDWVWTRLRQGDRDMWERLTDASLEKVITLLLDLKGVNGRRKNLLRAAEGPPIPSQRRIDIVVAEREKLFTEGVPVVAMEVNPITAPVKRKREDDDASQDYARKNARGVHECWEDVRHLAGEGAPLGPSAEEMMITPKGMIITSDMMHLMGHLQEKAPPRRAFWLSTQTSATDAITTLTSQGGKIQTFKREKDTVEAALKRAGIHLEGTGNVVLVQNYQGCVVQNGPTHIQGPEKAIMETITIDAETAHEAFTILKEWHVRNGFPLDDKDYWKLLSAIQDEKSHFALACYIASRLVYDMRIATNPFEKGDNDQIIAIKNGRYRLARRKMDIYVHHKILSEWFPLLKDAFVCMKERGLTANLGKKQVDLDILFKTMWDYATKNNLARLTASVVMLMQYDDFYEEHGLPGCEDFFTQLNRQEDVMALKNGCYHLGENRFIPNGDACKQFIMTYTTHYTYNEETEENEQAIRQDIEETLYKTLFPEEPMRRRVKEMIGSLLLGGNQEKVMWWMLGGRNTGKTSLIQALTAVFQDFASTADISILMKDIGCVEKPREDVLDIINRKVVFCSENDKHQKLNIRNVKTFQGGDNVSMRGMYGKIQKMPCMPTFVVATNDVPAMESEDEIDALRIKFIDFTVDMSKCQQKLSKKEWSEKVKVWAPVHFKMILEWFQQWKKNGMVFTDVETNAQKRVQDESATAHFIEDIENHYLTTDMLIPYEKHFYITAQSLVRDRFPGGKGDIDNIVNALKKKGFVCGSKRGHVGTKRVRYPIYIIEKDFDMKSKLTQEEYGLFMKSNSHSGGNCS